MAEGIRFNCENCGKNFDAWSDGNPYFVNETGEKQYAYHPDHKNLEKCTGNDADFVCLNCGEEFMVDSRYPDARCPKCSSDNTSDRFNLDGKNCPHCKSGTLRIDEGSRMIS